MGRVAAGSLQLGREITDQPRAATAAIRKSGGLSISREIAGCGGWHSCRLGLLRSQFALERRHRGDRRTKYSMSRHKVRVRQLGKRAAEMDIQRGEKRVCQFHSAVFVAEERFSSIRWIRFTPDMAGVDHPID
jgi:hypothetical protein